MMLRCSAQDCSARNLLHRSAIAAPRQQLNTSQTLKLAIAISAEVALSSDLIVVISRIDSRNARMPGLYDINSTIRVYWDRRKSSNLS